MFVVPRFGSEPTKGSSLGAAGKIRKALLSSAHKTRLTALALLIGGAGTLAQANEAVTHFTLDNGMEVVVVEDHRAPAVQQMVWYRAGAR